MSFEALLEPVPERVSARQSKCKLGNIIADLPDNIRPAVETGIAQLYVDGGLTDEEWADRFKRSGLAVSATIVNRHRKAKCACA
jgi:hypothetical protein